MDNRAKALADGDYAVSRLRQAGAPLPYPRAVTHVGLAVTDLVQAIGFYGNVFGARLLHGPKVLRSGDDTLGQICREFFGDNFGEAQMAYLATSNGVAIELFEFVTPKAERRPDGFEYWKVGFTHLCFIDPEVDRAVERLVAAGGRRRTATWAPWFDPGKTLALCEDPFGNVIEIYSHSSEQVVSNLHDG